MKKVVLKDLAKEMKSGTTLTRFKVESGEGEAIKVLSIKDINQDSILLAENIGDEVVVKDASLVEKFLLKDGDVVISTKGSAIKTATFRGEQEVVANGNLTVIKCRPDILPEYLTIFLKSERTVHELQMRSKGTAILNLTTSDLGMLEVPVPPLDVQKRLIKLHQELETYTDSRLEELRLVKQTVKQKTDKVIYK